MNSNTVNYIKYMVGRVLGKMLLMLNQVQNNNIEQLMQWYCIEVTSSENLTFYPK